MKIGIISDTHITKDSKSFIDLLDIHLKEVDLIIHAGDYVDEAVIKTMENFRAFIGVWGNVDSPEVRALIKEKEVINIEGYKIGVYHGHGKGSSTLDRAYEKFESDDVDIIIFGHSHQPLVKTKNGILMLNPGSLTNKRFERWFSYIILELHPEGIDLQFKFFPEK